MASEARDRYLLLYERNPERSAKDLCAEVGISYWTLKTSWRKKPDFLATERKIRQRHVVAQRVLKAARRAAEGGAAPPAAPEAPTLDPRLARWLEVYEACDDRIEACAKLQEEGIDLSWEEVGVALGQSEEFARRFQELWARGTIQAEDQLRKKARAGKSQELRAYLGAELPKKYGPRLVVKHQHGGTVRLEAQHRALVEGEGESFVRKYQRRAARALLAQAAATGANDIVEGEVLGPAN